MAPWRALTSKTVTAGTGSGWSNASDPGSNRLIGQSYDANGNAQFNGTSYDVENRLTARVMSQSPQYLTYQYDPTGHRVFVTATDGVSVQEQKLFFYDFTGRLAAAVNCTESAPRCQELGQQWAGYDGSNNVYFGGRQVISLGSLVVTDRLGSVRWAQANNGAQNLYLPYGELQSNSSTSYAQFTTYYPDSIPDNQDYADQRYYNPWMGRFNSADPAGMAAANSADPGSWNRYSYVEGDPVNRNDPTGSCEYSDEVGIFSAPCDYGEGLLASGVGPCGVVMALDPVTGETVAAPCGAAVPSPETVAPPPPTCSVELWKRPVPTTRWRFRHTYLVVDDPTGDFTVEGGPSGPGPVGYLVGTVAAVGSGKALGITNPGGPYNTEVGPAYTGPQACADAEAIVGAVESYNASGYWVKYNPIASTILGRLRIKTGYNSNSFASTLVNQFGLTSFFGFYGNFLTPGWGLMVPGL